jgi:hypothetical protein
MTSWKNLRRKLVQKLMEWPEHRKHEQAPGMGMTWWQMADCLVNEKKVSKIKRVVRQAEKAGLIRCKGGDEHGR